MKHWLFSVALVCFGSIASAQVVPAQLSTTTVCGPISISSQTPTQVYTPPTASAPYIQPVVSFYNTSASSAVYFSQSVNVSTQAASANLGWPIPALGSRDWTLLSSQTWYALASSVTSAITVIRCLTH